MYMYLYYMLLRAAALRASQPFATVRRIAFNRIIIIIMVYCNVVYYVAYTFDKVSKILFIHLLQIK